MNTSKIISNIRSKSRSTKERLLLQEIFGRKLKRRLRMSTILRQKKSLVFGCSVFGFDFKLGAVLFFDQDSKPNVQVAETNNTNVLKEIPAKNREDKFS